MIWFNIRSLEERLIRNEISEKTGYYYLLAFLILVSLALNNDDVSDFNSKYWRLADFVTGLVIMIFGLKKIFHINQQGDNKDFLKRYFSLSFVHAIRLTVLFFILALFLKIISEFLADSWGLPNYFYHEDLREYVFGLLFNLAIYFCLVRSFKKVNQGRLNMANPSIGEQA